jgi:mannose-1-phosphate guanylyltransferase
MKVQPVILAGGNGYRLWPLSQKTKPKQFVKNFANLTPTVVKDSILAIGVTKVYHHGFDN